MSSRPGVILQPRELAPPVSGVVPIFACPGAKETEVAQLVFPHGGGFSQLTACPMREVCLWYASHDLGGGAAINDLPAAAVVAPEFRTRPFACPHFQDSTARPRRAPRRWQAPALLGLIEVLGFLTCLDLADVWLL